MSDVPKPQQTPANGDGASAEASGAEAPGTEVILTEQLLNAYEHAFLTALREVEDALVATDTYETEFEAQRR